MAGRIWVTDGVKESCDILGLLVDIQISSKQSFGLFHKRNKQQKTSTCLLAMPGLMYLARLPSPPKLERWY